MKRLWVELQRWNKQRVPYCLDCPRALGPRLRRPIAAVYAEYHRAGSGHRTKLRRCG